MAQRIQLSRKKGWRLPEGAVVVSRPTMWGNPFSLEKCGTHHAAVKAYKMVLSVSQKRILEIAGGPPRFGLELIVWREKVRREIGTLRGKDLACWCPLDKPCHADVLLKLANPSLPKEASEDAPD